MDERMKNLNLVEILKDCPKGTKLYSPIFGDVKLVKVYNDGDYPIEVKLSDDKSEAFTKDGKLFTEYNGECTLFPSKYQRDWDKFKVEKPKKPKFKVGDKIVYSLWKNMHTFVGPQNIIPKITDDKYFFTDGSFIFISDQDSWELVLDKFDPKTLQPFDRVLVRDDHNQKWECNFFSYINIIDDIYYPYFTIINTGYKYCIPYNYDTKHLVGTTEEAPEFYRYWED